MVTITAAELQQKFDRYRDAARKEPVSVTQQGQEGLVILSAGEYKRLKALDTRKAVYPWELPDDLAEALETAEAPAFTTQFDHEFK